MSITPDQPAKCQTCGHPITEDARMVGEYAWHRKCWDDELNKAINDTWAADANPYEAVT